MTSFDEVPEWIWGSRGASRSSRLPAKDWAAPSRKNSPAKALTWPLDRKSTRLNSSHSQISYAVFCLKKKNPSVFVMDVTATSPAGGGAIVQTFDVPVAPGFRQALTMSVMATDPSGTSSAVLASKTVARAPVSVIRPLPERHPSLAGLEDGHRAGSREDGAARLRHQAHPVRRGRLAFYTTGMEHPPFFLNNPAPPNTPSLPPQRALPN